jgi:hypothetical protein
LQFRYRGSRRESAVAQLFSLGHEAFFGFYFAGLAGDDSDSSIWMSKISAVLARAGFALRASTAACD